MSVDLFAVVDTETTGLFPGGHDRIAEIAIVTMDRDGQVHDRWETLVNPERDLGKQSLHGIRARDVLRAPTFADIADELQWSLSGTIIMAHNLGFDARFLDAEFGRLGKPLPTHFLPSGLCTMRLSHEYLPGVGRSLRDCCDSFSIDLVGAHSAAGDAEATAILLSRYMEIDPEREDWNAPSTQTAARVRGESAPTAFIAPVLRGAPDGNREHFLERIVIRLPEFTGPSEHDEYLALVDRALVDRYLSAHEEEQLITTANEIGISRRQASELHRQYFEELVHAAWRDGVLTDLEIADLQLVASMLDIPAEAVDQARTPRDSQASANPAMATPLLGPGDKVVLTGDMSVPRSSIEDRLRAQGYVPHPGVTKAVKLVVAADPDSISGKARKARDYGIPVVGEDYLWKSVLTS